MYDKDDVSGHWRTRRMVLKMALRKTAYPVSLDKIGSIPWTVHTGLAECQMTEIYMLRHRNLQVFEESMTGFLRALRARETFSHCSL